MKVKSFSRVWLFATPWTVVYQAPLFMGFSRQEYWSGLPFPSPGDLPNLGSPELQADTLTSEPPGCPGSYLPQICTFTAFSCPWSFNVIFSERPSRISFLKIVLKFLCLSLLHHHYFLHSSYHYLYLICDLFAYLLPAPTPALLKAPPHKDFDVLVVISTSAA